MKCKVCGAYNEDYLEYCEKCAAPLTADNESEKPEEVQQPENKQNKGQDYQSYVASTGETPPAWGFVKAPNWPKPEFDADTVSAQHKDAADRKQGHKDADEARQGKH